MQGTSRIRDLPKTQNDFGNRGWIEVVGNRAVMLGYIVYDSVWGATISMDAEKATILRLPTVKGFKGLHLYMDNLPAGDSVPYLGLALFPSGISENKSVQPPLITDASQFQSRYSNYRSVEAPTSRLIRSFGCPNPEPVAEPKYDKRPKAYEDEEEYPRDVYLAGWKFAACKRSRSAAPYRRRSDTEIPEQRGSAAVWNYEPSTEELTMSLMMDDESEYMP
ncbi:hypothetical protein FRC00_011261 [Tulasnella sp. 408]|nr:hypothetical protein FRC00_011261 [Tulasnella sp. 408]